ncbi:hypothetical protein HJC23_013396 [Cyclotella cryptica]|uniref:Uncharacterized protein n=1 Tax=Cyclotella cryptica TaxID=29204 RepID=A0ABD3PWF4_9STRA|eukprot:CCRYP_010960-RA/>CCRYP_010960-RA protein AED:0.46 eAED:0.46 QI:0/-1/0/1/-1/1/1/0/70
MTTIKAKAKVVRAVMKVVQMDDKLVTRNEIVRQWKPTRETLEWGEEIIMRQLRINHNVRTTRAGLNWRQN